MRYVIITNRGNIRKEFREIKEGDVFDLYEDDGTLVEKSVKAQGDAFVSDVGLWTVICDDIESALKGKI